MATGIVDPDRRDHIISAALDVIAASGVAGLSMRKVADAADVPLGSLTYHFDGKDDLLRAAFEHVAATAQEERANRLGALTTRTDLVDALTDEVVELSSESGNRSQVISFELYVLAARDRSYRTITRGWMAASRAAMAHLVDDDRARQVDALFEGLVLHRQLEVEPYDRALAHDALAKIVGTAQS